MVRGALWFALLAVAAGCQVGGADPFVRGQRAAESGRFLDALEQLDQVPPSHANYAEARTLARALERRVRTGHEQILAGLALRSEWRDEEAIRRFEEALVIWDRLDGVDELIRATKVRMQVLGGGGGQEPARPLGEGASAGAVKEPVPVKATTPVGTDPVRSPEQVEPQVGEKQVTAGGEAAVVQGEATQDSSVMNALRRRQRLEQVTRLFGKGEKDRALDLLQELYDESPKDREVVDMLVRILHQRALLAYGQGRLDAAIDDWHKVVRLRPEAHAQQQFLRAAEIELASRQDGN